MIKIRIQNTRIRIQGLVCNAEVYSQTWRSNLWLPEGRRGRRDSLGVWTDMYALLGLELISKGEPAVCIAQATLPDTL